MSIVTQDLMSSLRLKHDLHPIVRQLESCDYVVSARMAVERKLLSGKYVMPRLETITICHDFK